jgi:tRNA-specific 2-thiouridylase
VIKKDVNRNIVYVSKGYDTKYQYGDVINLQGFDFITKDVWGDFEDEKDITFKIRHTPEFTRGKISKTGDLYRIQSAEPVQGIAAGQFGVVYDERQHLCLGSGMII